MQWEASEKLLSIVRHICSARRRRIQVEPALRPRNRGASISKRGAIDSIPAHFPSSNSSYSIQSVHSVIRSDSIRAALEFNEIGLPDFGACSAGGRCVYVITVIRSTKS